LGTSGQEAAPRRFSVIRPSSGRILHETTGLKKQQSHNAETGLVHWACAAFEQRC
jgi:formate dehydrogenase assembly factor FdhD